VRLKEKGKEEKGKESKGGEKFEIIYTFGRNKAGRSRYVRIVGGSG